MKEKMRATHHSGRKGKKGAYSSKHNDRNYDYENAQNINSKMTNFNIYYNCYDGFYSHKNKENKMTFEEVETKFCYQNFWNSWNNTCNNYVRQGHSERCLDFYDWLKLDKNLPEELYMQVGNVDNNNCSKEKFLEVMKLYTQRLNEWNDKNGNPFTIVNTSLQVDEAVPQMHLRRYWHYKDCNGNLSIGQEKALEQAGIPLPKPNQKKSRHNNRKMTFDKMCREMYLQCCFDCGLDIETVPLCSVNHNMDKIETINKKLYDKQKQQEKKDIEQQETEIKQKQKDVEQQQTEQRLNDLKDEISNERTKLYKDTLEAQNVLNKAKNVKFNEFATKYFKTYHKQSFEMCLKQFQLLQEETETNNINLQNSLNFDI